MAVRKLAHAPVRIPDKDIRQQLDRMLASATFQQVDRLKRFLKFIVLETAAGRGEELKEYVVGVQVFGKESSFDPRTDPIVRVQARRLRARLETYARAEGQQDDILIELPKGGYAPIFKLRDVRPVRMPSIGVALAGRNTIAVLPFADLSPAGDLGYFCGGLAQEIVHRLARFKALRVMTADTVDANAAFIVTGSIRRSGDEIRVITQLVDTPTGSYLWSDAITASLTDTLTAQDEIAQAVVKKLQPEQLERGQVRWGRPPMENLAANNLYLQGRYHLNQRTEEGLLKAVDFFEKAIVEDAQYSLAHSGLADAYGLLAHYGVRGPADVWTKAASSAASAVLLDPHSAEAHTSLAHVKATQDWDWPGAEREYVSAVGLNPRYATAHHWYAMSCLVPMGRLDQGLEQISLAQALDPVSSIIARDVAVMHYYRRDFDAALEQCDHTIELNPHFSPAYLTLSLVQEQRHDLDEAIAALERAVHLSPQSPRMQGALGQTQARSGKRDAALKSLRRLDSLAKERYVSPFEFACLHFALDQTDLGFKWLTKACADRCFEMIAMKVDSRFDSLKDDPRMVAIVDQIGLR